MKWLGGAVAGISVCGGDGGDGKYKYADVIRG